MDTIKWLPEMEQYEVTINGLTKLLKPETIEPIAPHYNWQVARDNPNQVFYI